MHKHYDSGNAALLCCIFYSHSCLKKTAYLGVSWEKERKKAKHNSLFWELNQHTVPVLTSPTRHGCVGSQQVIPTYQEKQQANK